MVYKIVQAPNPVLSKQAEKVQKIDKQIKTLISDMVATLESASDPEGVGLAAPQIGKSLQLFVVKESKNAPIITVINPKLETIGELPTDERIDKKTGKKKSVPLEGCLSLKDIWGIVKRYKKVRVSYLDENGVQHNEEFSGFLAVIMQHEYDHLQGVLFPKRVLEQKGELYKSEKDEKGEVVFEEISI
jgi:peptide deformylase